MPFIIHVSAFCADTTGRILIVQEGKPGMENLINLPGGHLEEGEGLIAATQRELLEETGIEAEIDSLIGVYVSSTVENHYLHFVFQGIPRAFDIAIQDLTIVSAEWMSLLTLADLPDRSILNPHKFRQIITDAQSGKRLPISQVNEEYLVIKF